MIHYALYSPEMENELFSTTSVGARSYTDKSFLHFIANPYFESHFLPEIFVLQV